MKNIFIGVIIIIIGLFISLGPQFLFKSCKPGMSTSANSTVDDECCTETEVSSCCSVDLSNIPICYWTVRAEVGIGFLIISLGACLIIFSNIKIQFGLLIGTFFSGIIALFMPLTLIGGCSSIDMLCHKVAFPALIIESIILIIFSSIILTIFYLQKHIVEK